jgi:hypothetical protein
MSHRRSLLLKSLAAQTILLAGAMGLVRCGGSNGTSTPTPDGGPDSGPRDATADGATGDSATADSAADGGSDADSATSADGEVDSATTTDASDAGLDGAIADGAKADAGDAGAKLVCGSQTCGAGDFCGTEHPADSGADANADGDSASDAAAAAPTLACETAVFSHLCDNPKATIFFDPYPSDNTAAVEMANALAATCGTTIESPPASDAGLSADAGIFDLDSGEPRTGIGNICLIGGGSTGQPAVTYLDMGSLSDVYLWGQNNDAGVFTLYFTNRASPASPVDLASEPYTATPPNQDYFLLQLDVDPASGSLCFQAMGMSSQGTLAAGYYAANDLIGNGAYATSTKSWYVYQWTDANGNGTPDGADTYMLVASGP